MVGMASSKYIHQDSLISGLTALYLAHERSGVISKEESYTCGYRDGFEASLDAIAQLVGASTEFERVKVTIGDRSGEKLIIPNG
jgi:hypothetical protein